MKSRRRTRPSSERLRTTPVFKAYQIKGAMSVLGQKQTFALHQPMSALHPKADIRSALADVSFGPEADPCSATNSFAIRSPRRRGRGEPWEYRALGPLQFSS